MALRMRFNVNEDWGGGANQTGNDWKNEKKRKEEEGGGKKGRWKNKDYTDYIYKTGAGMTTGKRNLYLFVEVSFRLIKFKMKDKDQR